MSARPGFTPAPGLLQPMIGVIAMTASSLAVIDDSRPVKRAGLEVGTS